MSQETSFNHRLFAIKMNRSDEKKKCLICRETFRPDTPIEVFYDDEHICKKCARINAQTFYDLMEYFLDLVKNTSILSGNAELITKSENNFKILRSKNKTDIDIYAVGENFNLLIECKEIKTAALKLREKNYFNKIKIEHYYKTKWICQNYEKFLAYFDTDPKIIGAEIHKPIVSLILTNKLVNIKDSPGCALLTYTELVESLTEENYEIKEDQLIIHNNDPKAVVLHYIQK